ncbi:CoA transferase [Polaromonas sp.]|uniref:CoA transferase n=1 Tax=Polaromonas sp. TaxID=1869339 RepID=UPI001D8EDD52|nr:CoA transferase [Polaromonas sp.]MBT9475170.1 CoA transferase [Polaromonas sp.]
MSTQVHPEDRPKGILSGLRVIDLAAGLAGCATALYLAEAGAEVLKIVRPSLRADDDAVLFRVLDRGKRRVDAGLQEGGESETLKSLLATADVLVHDLTPAEAEAWSLGELTLARQYPSLVIASIGAWPRGHAWSDSPLRETLVLARLGLLDEQPGHRPGPIFIRMPFASWMASWLSAIGVMARLLARDRDGRGGIANTSLAQAALATMTMHWSRAERPSPAFAKGLDKNTPIPLHQCADGRWIHVHYSPDAAPWMAQALAEMGEQSVARANALWPPSHVAPNFGANRQIIATRSAQDWVAHFWAHDVSAQIAAPFGEIYSDAQARLNSYAIQVEDPVLGRTWQPGPGYSVDPPARVRQPVPALSAENAAAWTDVPASAAPRLVPPDAAAPALPPLHGLKVLDLGAYLAGPFACMVLADLGAEVIKVEPPAGDAMRRLEKIFAGTQRGKRGLALKLGVPGSQPVLEALVSWADVVHHNVRLPAARKLGIAPEQLRALKPELVCAHVSSYGPTGPRADWPGFDQLMQASCGWEVECGGEGNPPMWLRFGVGDFLAGLSSVFALLLALYQRARTGQGQAVSSSLLGAMLMTASEAVVQPDGRLTPIEHLDAGQTGVSATHRIYSCSDGWIAVAALTAPEVESFNRLTGDDPVTCLGAMVRAAALACLQAAGVPCEPVLEAQAAAFLASAEHAASGLHAHYPHAQYGALQQIGALWDFNDLPLAINRPPPVLGEHSREVLEMLGFTAQDIEALQVQGLTRL